MAISPSECMPSSYASTWQLPPDMDISPEAFMPLREVSSSGAWVWAFLPFAENSEYFTGASALPPPVMTVMLPPDMFIPP